MWRGYDGKEIGHVCGDGSSCRDSRESYNGPDDRCCESDGDGEDQQGRVDRHVTFLRETPEVLASWQDTIARDGVCNALRGHEARGCGAGGVDPEEGKDACCAVGTDELYEVFRPVVGRRCRR